MEILKLLEEEGSARVSYLSELFKVTEVTIRKDLEKLEADGLIYKEHGGAFLKMMPDKLLNLTMQNAENMDKKFLIGKKAAEYINTGDTIIIDSGTTTTELAKQITNNKRLTVITTSLSVALHLGSKEFVEIHITGGEFKAPSLSVTGSQAAEFFKGIHVDKLFLSAIGISLRTGLTYSGISDVVVKREMTKSAEKVYLLVDSTKVEKQSFASLGDVNLVQVVITDKGIKPEYKQALEKAGIEVVVAE